jgi:hypothetical protein
MNNWIIVYNKIIKINIKLFDGLKNVNKLKILNFQYEIWFKLLI